MQIADLTRIKKRVISILKANRDAFAATIATDPSRQRRIYDSDEEIGYFIEETDLKFANAIAANPNHPFINLFRVEKTIAHGQPISAYSGVILTIKLINGGNTIDGLLINSQSVSDEDARRIVLDARENFSRFGGKDAIKDAVAICNQHIYIADDRNSTAKICVSDVQRTSGVLHCPDTLETGIIAGAVVLAMRDGADLDVVKQHAGFEIDALQSVVNGATITNNLP